MRKILSVLCSVMLCFCVVGLFAVNYKTQASNYGIIVSTELFIPSEVTIEPLCFDSEVLYMDSALKLSSENTKESVRMKNQLSGEFTMEYLPEKLNTSYTAEKFTITFTDATTQESFALNFEHGDTTNVNVEVNGQKVGLYYVSGATQGLTTLCNATGDYTAIVAKKIGLKFDPDTMSLYAGAAGEKLTLVWSLTQSEIDGKTFEHTISPFNTYWVDLAITDISSVRPNGEVLIYNINGCKFDNIILENEGDSSIFANFEENALVNVAYELPELYVSDIVGGAKKVKVQPTITDASGKNVTVTNGKFTPDKAQEYSIVYAYGNVSKEYKVTAFESKPVYDYEILYNLSESYPTNSQVIIPEMTLTGGILRYGKLTAKVSVVKDGVVLSGCENLTSGTSFVFETEGNYVLRYDIGAGKCVEYSLTIENQDIQFMTDGLETFYEKGAYINASQFKVVDKGQEVDFAFYVQYPDGNKYSNKKFVLNDVGVYTLCARYDDGQNVFVLTKKITVNAKTTDFFSHQSTGVDISYGRSLMTGRSGVKIHFSEADQLITYTLPIDISAHKNIGVKNEYDVTKVSSSAKPIIELTIDPKNKGTQAASGVNVYITDAANPSNVITLSTLAQGSTAWSYMRAGATGQDLVGFFNDTTDKTFHYDNTYGYITGNGTMFYHATKGGVVSGYTAQDSKIAIYYDSETKQIFTHNARLAKTDIVVDLDDSKFTNAPWAGFESNLVYLSFSLAYVTSTGADVTVYSIDGKSFESEEVSYSSEPNIQLKDKDIVLTGIKGRNFVIPEVEAFDCWGSPLTKVVSKVYYQSSKGLIHLTVNDNKFKTDKAGTYLIEYTAKDIFGNVGTEKVTIQVKDSHPSLSISVANIWKEKKTVATNIDICPVDELIVSNAVGVTKITRSIYFTKNNQKLYEITDQVMGDSFYTTNPGRYFVEYTVVDGTLRSFVSGYFIDVETSSDFVIVSPLPTFVGFVRGNSYEIPKITLVDYLNGEAQEKVADVYINGKLFEGDIFSIERGEAEAKDATEKQENVIIEYKCGDATISSYTVPVKTVYKLDTKKLPGGIEVPYTKFMQERFFIAQNGAEHLLKANGVTLSSTTNDGKISFVQPLASENLSFVLDVNFEKTFEKDENGSIIPQNTNVKKFTITLTDALDASKVLVLTFTTNMNNGYAAVSVKGLNPQDTSASFVGMSDKQLSIRYDNVNKKIIDVVTGTQILTPKTYENGKPFEGFSQTVYVNFAFECVKEGVPAELFLYSINAQSFSNGVNEDSGEPSITIDGKLNGVFSYGDSITIPSAKAADVFGSVIGNGKFNVSVYIEKGESKTYVQDVKGQLLKEVSPSETYQVVFGEVGTYRIIYYAQDSNGVKKEVAFAVTVVHDNKPNITINGTMPTQAKVNQKVVIPDASVNYFEQAVGNHFYIYVISPSYDYEIIKNNSFIAKEEGVYTIRYYALDVYGNYQITDYQVQVSK